MYSGPIEDLVLARMADYERLVARLLLEREAKAVNAEAKAAARKPRSRHLPWIPGRTRPDSAI